MAGPVVPAAVDEVEKIWRWRYTEVRRMGFDEVAAEHLAESRVDLHRLKELLDQGCSHDLAADILS